jgi:hypothetical protein
MERTTDSTLPTVTPVTRFRRARTLRLGLFALVLALGGILALSGSRQAIAQPDSTITVKAFQYNAADGTLGAALPEYTYIVNADNSGDVTSTDPLARPSLHGTESNSAVVATGDQSSPAVSLPDGRYLISIRSPGHKLWGKLIRLPADAGDVNIGLRSTPAPLGKLIVQVFEDNGYTNSAPDEGEQNLAGFRVTLTEQTGSQVIADYLNHPLCGGDCITGPDGSVTIENLSPATYNVFVHPPAGDGHNWAQTTTLFGGYSLPASVAEGSNGTGLGGEGGWADPNLKTSYLFGFVDTNTHFALPGTAAITGQALNWVGWPPYDQLVADPNDPVRNAYVALSDATTNQLVNVSQADSEGNFTITDVPAGSYNVAIWDEGMSYIMRFLTITVADGQALDLAQIGVARWFGWVTGTVYQDTNGNAIYEPDLGETPLPNFPQDIRWRDGSIADTTTTDSNGYYEYPQAEGGYLGKWVINETGFTRMGVTGASVHNEHDPTIVTPIPTDLGGALLSAQLTSEGHRSIVDWGHQPYADGQAGQIVGVVYFATTRNEFDAALQAHENYEPGIPDVTVNLEATNGTLLNTYVTDHWKQPTGCAYGDLNGAPVPGLNPLIGSLCLEVPINGNQSKDAAFDGGYAFADYCPNGYDTGAPDTATAPCWNLGHTGHVAPDPLVPGDYVTHVVMPTDANGKDIFHIVREEDVNVDLGTEYVPAIPPPPCVGSDHVIDQSTLTPRSNYYGVPGAHAPLCDEKLVHLLAKQNANADFNLMTNFANGKDVSEAGRIVGLVTDNVAWERDIQSIWYGEPRPVGGLPIGIYDYAGRLLTTTHTDENGGWEVVLPSTETYNCPIPQGPCPGMYVVKINDPGSKAHPNANYSVKYLGQTLEQEVWPGLTSQMDIPVSPVAGTGCYLPTGTPELLQATKLVERPTETNAARRVTLQGDFFGAAPGSVLIDDTLGRLTQATLTQTIANGGLVSWSDRQIVLNVPAAAAGFLPGPKQITIRGSNGLSSVNGITLHVLGTSGATTYNPTVVDVPLPTSNPHALQNAIDTAAPGSLLVLAPGIYRENIILHKPLTLQGRGVGGNVGTSESPNVPADDPRFQLLGSGIDGRFFADNEVAWNAKLASLTFSGNHAVSKGADITVVSPDAGTGSFTGRTGLAAPRIDGIALTTGRGRDGAGGIQVNAYGRNLQITNNVLESDSGAKGGGIGIGSPYNGNQHNENITMNHLRVLGSGGNRLGGGIVLFNGSDNYDIEHSTLCANFSMEYGAGISHWGNSPGGSIHDNRLYYNDSVDSGAGISITEEVPVGGGLGTGTGSVEVLRNLIQSNMAGDDGGGLWIQNAQTARILVRNNMIVANGAADGGGGLSLGNSSNVALVNNTIADNVSTGTYPGSTTWTGAGLFAHANSPDFHPAGTAAFADPAVMFNNIFWQNEALTPDLSTVPPTLASHGFVDFQIESATPGHTFANARFNLFTNALIRQSDGSNTTIPAGGAAVIGFPTNPAQNGNIVGVDPMFVTQAPPSATATVSVNARDPQMFDVQLAPPDVSLAGDYHLVRSIAGALTSGAIDRGVRCSNYAVPPPAPTPAQPFGPPCAAGGEPAPIGLNADIDGNLRPQPFSPRLRTLWDFGADEVTTLP